MLSATRNARILGRIYFKRGHVTTSVQPERCLKHVTVPERLIHQMAPVASVLEKHTSWHSLLLVRGTHDNSAFSGAPTRTVETTLSAVEFEQVCEETLDSLAEVFEDLADSELSTDDFDIQFASGVLTVKLDGSHGTYVINKQTPNMQIWLSSPSSGPKRYDYMDGRWIYKHDGNSLHQLLTDEISSIFRQHIDFLKCAHSQKSS